MTIRSRALQNWHTDRCIEGCLFEALYPAPSARPFSKGLLVSYAIPYFHFSACSLRRIRARQISLDFASDDDTDRCASSCHSILRLWRDSSSRGCSVDVSYRNILLYAPIKKIPPELMLQRDLFNSSLSTVHSSPFRRFFWRYRAIPGGCFPERGR